ncbi:MAG: S1C family serine protease [Planctomycetaceae bacterium]
MKKLPRTLIALLVLSGTSLLAEVPESRLPRAQYKSGASVRAAFREVVQSPRHSTVRVFCDGKPAALGVIVDADGGILTKASQLSGTIVCRLSDDREFDARIAGVEEKLDLALLRINAQSLRVIEWDQANPDVGQWLVTPGIEDVPVAVGVVSVRSRTLPEQRGVLGVAIESAKEGPRVTRVFSQSPAEKSGLKVGDIIRRVAGMKTSTEETLVDAIGRHQPGEKIELEFARGDATEQIQITLDHAPPEMLSRSGFMNHLGGRLSRRRSGFPPVLQHDTVISPEECGGPVVGLAGKAIGINVARAGRTETYALPVATILPVLAELKSGKLAPLKPAESEKAELPVSQAK